MAQLSSPGVSVTVIDESFYTPAAPGTVPLIIVASGENKANSAGTGIAPGTLKANAGKVYLLTSQMDLGTTFGIPYFQTDANNNPVHAGEINEYGLQAAYSFLGISNRAYVVRADLDTSQLAASGVAPAGEPADGTFWLDTSSSHYGIFEWNSAPASSTGGQTFTNKVPTVITDITKVVDFEGGDFTPKASVGAIGDYSLVAVTNLLKLWFKNLSGTWVEVGSANWAKSWATVAGTTSQNYGTTNRTLIINGHLVTNSQNTQQGMATAITNSSALTALGISAGVVSGRLQIYSTGVDVEIQASAVISGVPTTATGTTEAGLTAGTYAAPVLNIKPHTQPPQYKIAGENRPTGSLWVKATTPNLGANYIVKRYNAETMAWDEQVTPMYVDSAAALAALDPAGGGVNLLAGTSYVKYNDDGASPVQATFKVYVRASAGQTVITSAPIGSGTLTGSVSFTMAETLKASTDWSATKTISFTAAGTLDDADTLAQHINNAGFTNVLATVVNTTTSTRQVVITHILGGDVKFDDAGTTVNSLYANSANFYADSTSNGSDGKYVGSLWTASVGGNAIVTASSDAIVAEPNDGQLWYNSVVDEVDIMIHNGHKWVGYQNYTGYSLTDPNGPQVAALPPKKQSDDTALVVGDLWISTADLENYPLIHRWDGTGWVLLDNTDQTTENGVLFHDARWNDSGLVAAPSSIKDLLTSDFVDFDAPDPALYPQGMLLWNLRRSGNNVLKFVKGYVDQTHRNPRVPDQDNPSVGELMTDYVTDKWISEAPNNAKGAGAFGRKAQRAVVLKALNALINENQQIRDEDSRVFNLMACPGYLETLPALNSLNADRGLLSFIVADAPARLTPDATSLSNWGNNTANATGDGDDALISTDPYSAVYYPWGYTTDLVGNNIAVPASHIMLRTIALSDNVSYPWFAPAGTRRGGATNVSSVGYVTAEGEFQPVALNNGQRDTLASINVNPITYIGGVGIVAYGQKTRQLVASALDRINVARLVIYLRYQLNQLAKPYIFEPNDTITRNEIKQQVEKLMLELTGQRALYDYLVVCDTSNNTPARIDRNELHVDIAIEPVKAVEFIYIPLRLKNTGEIKGLGA